jgi:3-hydroxyacyl-[acyl-carrier-protein] dehydratase
MSREHEIERIIPADHPSLAGHFPGNPIVPGVVILDEVIDALLQTEQARGLSGIPSVKFTAPLRPEQAFLIRFGAPAGGRVDFRCTLPGGQILAQGQLQVVTQE